MKIYLSHPIMGSQGLKATDETMKANCEKAIEWAESLRMNLARNSKKGKGVFVSDIDGIHSIYLTFADEIYVPAEHEDFVNRAYKMGLLTVEQILAVDCEIVKSCDALIALGPVSNGMRAEIDCANEHGIRVIYVDY